MVKLRAEHAAEKAALLKHGRRHGRSSPGSAGHSPREKTTTSHPFYEDSSRLPVEMALSTISLAELTARPHATDSKRHR